MCWNEQVLLHDDPDHHQMILRARVDAVETVVESQMGFLSLLARVCRTESLMHPAAMTHFCQSESRYASRSRRRRMMLQLLLLCPP